MTVTFELDLGKLKMNDNAKYSGQWSYCLKAAVETDKSKLTALPKIYCLQFPICIFYDLDLQI